MAFDLKGFLFSLIHPAAPSGSVNLPFQVEENGPNMAVSVSAPILVGDSGSGGSAGLAPAPVSGDGAAKKWLKATGAWLAIVAGDLAGAVFGASGAGHSVGAVPDPGSSAGTTRFLREDATWVAPSSGITLKHDGTNNGSQTLLNLKGGTGVTIADDGSGGITLSSSSAVSPNVRAHAVNQSFNGVTTATAAIPGTAQAGDLALISIGTNASSISTPSGWTLQAAGTTSGSSAWKASMFSKVLVSGDIGATISFTLGSSAQATSTLAVMIGAPTIREMDLVFTAGGASFTNTVTTSSSAAAGDLCLYFGSTKGTVGSPTGGMSVNRGVALEPFVFANWAAILYGETLTAGGAQSALYSVAGTGGEDMYSCTVVLQGAAPSGSVTYVGLTVPSRQSVSGSPITNSGTLAITDNNQSANLVFAGPASGGAAAPTFRTLVSADVPSALSNPMAAAGDIIIGGSSGTPTRLAKATDGQVLTLVSGSPAWAAGAGGGAPAYTQPSTAVPTVASLTAMNQSTATAVDSAAGIYMHQTSGATQYIFALTQNVPGSTPYTFTVAIIPNIPAANFAAGGICISDGTKLITFGFQYNSGLAWVITKWNSATSYNSDYTSMPTFPKFLFPIPVLWLRYVDNGTTRTYSYSVDGANFINVRTGDSRTDFLTATKLGVAVICNGASDVYMTVSSWAVT